VPWTISDRAMRLTTVSSGLITTHASITGEPSSARATSGPNGSLRPKASPGGARWARSPWKTS
jgi:hypothetical protein